MPQDLSILIVSADASVTQKCSKALSAFGFRRLQIADSMERARMELRVARPAVVLLDESALHHPGEPCSLESAARELTEVSPVVVAAAYARLPELTSLIASGAVDFVARRGEFPRAAARLLGRHLGLPESRTALKPPPHEDKGDDFGELLRHEVNNPLTGILGNTELLLARPEQLPPGAIERLQTIADLAVRLREIVRHLSNTWEANHQPIGPPM
jgi:DNA-binding NtrC family response regulator